MSWEFRIIIHIDLEAHNYTCIGVLIACVCTATNLNLVEAHAMF